ncbi:DUF1833 family protein [Enterovirga sp. CN4-39]|uniref:DUF1833 family protein n=1 Tax=Enterovirga sp. CN4-39 TaxID=3400910 RepID=UPI003C06F4AF
MPITVSDAWAEAAVTAPRQEVMLLTLEFHHPAFVENGLPTAIRAVRNTEDLMLRLDAGAPLNAGQVVLFKAIPFEVDYPRIGQLGAEATIRLDNVNREVSRYLASAVTMNQTVKVIFRGYLASDPDTVGHGPYTLELRNVTRKSTTLEGKIVVASPGQLKFLRQVYDQQSFPSLMAVS